MSNTGTECLHEEVEWEPIQIDYDLAGTGSVAQAGICSQCGAKLQLNYEPGEPNVVG